jgi:hypothetical protein
MVQSLNSPPATELIRLEDLTDATTVVAMLKQEPIELTQNDSRLIFQLSYDGLDYLDFASFTLNTGEFVTLVRHHGCPEAGTEICVATLPEKAAQVIDRTCEHLKISKEDLVWVHPSIQT